MFVGAKPQEAPTVGAKHRMTETPEQRRLQTAPGPRRTMSGVATVCDIVSASMLSAAIMTALVSNMVEQNEHNKPTVVVSQGPPPVSQPVRQEGTLIAVSADSVTARSANGYTQTYLLTPNTTVISHRGSQLATATSHFTVNDQVDIIGTIHDGRALATAVADRDMANGNGTPMDYVATQPISGAPGTT
jgi:hypothetical protein